jgi:hypothetical protein
MNVYSQALGMAPGDDGREVTQESYCEKLKNAMLGMVIGEPVWVLRVMAEDRSIC